MKKSCGGQTIDCINNGRNICDISHWFVYQCLEASSLDFGRRHPVFLEPEVTIFGKVDDAELVVLQYQTKRESTELALH